MFLFEPRETFSYNWGERIFRPPPVPGYWDVADPDIPGILCEAIEQKALPLLRPVKTIEDFVDFTGRDALRDTYLDLYELRKIFVDVARGDIDAATSICEFLATERARRKHLPMMAEEYDRITKTLCPLIAANDRPGSRADVAGVGGVFGPTPEARKALGTNAISARTQVSRDARLVPHEQDSVLPDSTGLGGYTRDGR